MLKMVNICTHISFCKFVTYFFLTQSNEAGSSQQTELEGLKRSFQFLKQNNIEVPVFVSDRHKGINKWIREVETGTKHYFDIWHVARSITKKLQKAGKNKGFEIILAWIKAVRNHLYWCATTTSAGFQEMIISKWKSFLYHVTNEHKNFPDKLIKECCHEEDLEERCWIKCGKDLILIKFSQPNYLPSGIFLVWFLPQKHLQMLLHDWYTKNCVSLTGMYHKGESSVVQNWSRFQISFV